MRSRIATTGGTSGSALCGAFARPGLTAMLNAWSRDPSGLDAYQWAYVQTLRAWGRVAA